MRTAGMRKLGPEALTEAITVPSAFRTGAAMAVSPASSSSAAVAKPRAIQVGKIKGSIGVRGGKTVLELKTPLAPEKLDRLESFVRDLLALS